MLLSKGVKCSIQKEPDAPFIDQQFGLQFGEQLTAKADAGWQARRGEAR
jgi:hypothetical protein